MKQLITCAVAGCLLLASATLRAQIILHIAPGGQLFIGAKTAVSFDSLVVVPAANGFLLGENDISKLATPNNPFEGTFLKRVYCFSHPVTDYNGSLGIFYNEEEANGSNVNKLSLQAYSPSGWRPLDDSKSRNARHHVVGVLGVHHLAFSELLLGYRLCDSLLAKPDAKQTPLALAPLAGGTGSIIVYPNPATSVVNVQLNANTVVKSIKMYDAAGKLLMLAEGNAGNRYSFNVSQLASGIYTILVETSTNKLSKSFVKE